MTSTPSNVEELFSDQVWRRKLTTAVSTFKLHEDPADTLSEIFVLMLSREDPEGRGFDYIQRWDASKSGSFANWVYTFVRNFCIKKLDRQRSVGGRAIEGALTLVERGADKEAPDPGTIFTDWVGEVSPDISTVEIRASLTGIVADLEQTQPAHSWVEYTADGYWVRKTDGTAAFYRAETEKELVGQTVRRDVATVLSYLVFGELDSAEIASLFKTSRQFVYTLVERLRSNPALLDLRASI